MVDAQPAAAGRHVDRAAARRGLRVGDDAPGLGTGAVVVGGAPVPEELVGPGACPKVRDHAFFGSRSSRESVEKTMEHLRGGRYLAL